MAKVVDIKITQEIKPSLPIKEPLRYCSHRRVQVDEHQRELTCQECEAVLDPFEFILSVAREERMHFWNKKEVQDSIKQLSEERERLQKDVNNLKSQKKRLAE